MHVIWSTLSLIPEAGPPSSSPWVGLCCSCGCSSPGSRPCPPHSLSRQPRGSVWSGRPAGPAPSLCTTAWSTAACRGRAWRPRRRLTHTAGAGCRCCLAGCLAERGALQADPADSHLVSLTTHVNTLAAAQLGLAETYSTVQHYADIL